MSLESNKEVANLVPAQSDFFLNTFLQFSLVGFRMYSFICFGNTLLLTYFFSKSKTKFIHFLEGKVTHMSVLQLYNEYLISEKSVEFLGT